METQVDWAHKYVRMPSLNFVYEGQCKEVGHKVIFQGLGRYFDKKSDTLYEGEIQN